MKKWIIHCVLFFVVTFSAVADSLHSKNVDEAIGQILFGETVQIKVVARQVYGGSLQNQKLTDIMAEKLAQNYLSLAESEVDTYAWVAKSLSKTPNNRYKSLLQKIYSSNIHKKLYKHVKRSLKDIKRLPKAEQYILGSVNIESAKDEYESFKPKEKSTPRAGLNIQEKHLFNIANGDLNKIKKIAQRVEKGAIREQEVVDALAEYLSQNAQSSAEYEWDTMAWICRALGALDNQRYLGVLKTDVRTSSQSRKIEKYAAKSIRAIKSEETAEAYVPGSVNLDELLEKFSE